MADPDPIKIKITDMFADLKNELSRQGVQPNQQLLSQAKDSHPLPPTEQHNEICPYLGTHTDSETAFSFPNSKNCCYQFRRPRSLDLAMQEMVCLDKAHIRCHQFNRELAKPDRGIKLILNTFTKIIKPVND